MSRNLASPGDGGDPAMMIDQPDGRGLWASRLERAADAELTLGHLAIAERLSRLASDMREAAR